jgi:hypothetical protein
LDGRIVITEYTDTRQSTVLCVVDADDRTRPKRLGVCTDQPDVGGVCTCSAL